MRWLGQSSSLTHAGRQLVSELTSAGSGDLVIVPASVGLSSARRHEGSVPAFVIKSAALLMATGFAFSQTFTTLTTGRNGPVSTVSGALLIAACVLAVIEGLVRRVEPDIHDRTIDYVLGVTALAMACIILWITPITSSLFFWLWRLDWIAIPFFIAGSVALLFGVRTVWRQRLPILLLFAAWPMPWIGLHNAGWIGVLDSTTEGVATWVGQFLQRLGVVSSVGDTSTWSTYAGLVLISVVVIAIALVSTMPGRTAAKAAWALLAMGTAWLLSLGVLVGASLLMPAPLSAGEALLPGLSMGFITVGMTTAVAWVARRQRGVRVARTSATWGNRLGARAIVTALIAVLAAGLLLGAADRQLGRYKGAADDFGSSTLVASGDLPSQLVGWTSVSKLSHRWGAVYLDKSATWTRYTYEPMTINGHAAAGQGSFTIDVISTTDLNSLSTYDVAANYQLQGHQLLSSAHVDLGSGIVGQAVQYALGPNRSSWIGVYWEWQVWTRAGPRYERLVFSALDSTLPGSLNYQVSDPTLAVGLAIYNSLAGLKGTSEDVSAASVRAFLVQAARQTVLWAEPSTALP